MKKVFLCLLVLSLLLVSGICLGEGENRLPLDLSGGMKPVPAGFKGDCEYEDDSIHVTVEKSRYNDCDYWIARIRIADPSQLRTAYVGNFEDYSVTRGTALARRVNSVIAIDGDYWWYSREGFIRRQGTTYLNVLEGNRDILLIDEDGDFHTVPMAKQGEVADTINGKNVVNAFYFGPTLVENGEAVTRYSHKYDDSFGADWPRQRMCIAQVDTLEYMFICCAGPARGSYGQTLPQFARVVASMGVKTAYNLDGGDSTMLIFNGEKINDPGNNSAREISDIVYFASARNPEE